MHSEHKNPPSTPGASRPQQEQRPSTGVKGRRIRQSEQICLPGRSDAPEHTAQLRGQMKSRSFCSKKILRILSAFHKLAYLRCDKRLVFAVCHSEPA